MGVPGYREFTAFLGKVETELKDAKWLFEATEYVRDEAKRRVPVRTGELRDSIDCYVQQAEGGMNGVIYSDCEHSLYVEFGTGKKGSENHVGISPEVPVTWDLEWEHGQAAQPFLYPALKDNEPQIIEIANKGIKKALESK